MKIFSVIYTLLLFLLLSGCGNPVTVERFDNTSTVRDTTPPEITRGPWHDQPIKRVKQSGLGNTFAVIVHWETDVRANSKLYLANNVNFLDTGSNNADEVSDTYSDLKHDLLISDIDGEALLASVTYFYYVESEDPAGNSIRSAVIPITMN
ncbi:hypothetical protein ACFL35_00570 [Candidatus Riflebacteria bacterium]